MKHGRPVIGYGLIGVREWLCNAEQAGWYRDFFVPEALRFRGFLMPAPKTFPLGEGGSPQGLTDEVKTSPTTSWSPLPKGEGINP